MSPETSKKFLKHYSDVKQKGIKNMYEKILKYFPNAFYLISVLIIALGIILAVLGAFFYGIGGNEFVLTGASILITLGVGCFSLGFAFLSIGIAKESDKKMATIATSDFLDIAHRFEDLKNFIVGVDVDSKGKITWPGYWPGTGRSYYVWKCEQLMKRAVELLQWNIAPEYQEQLARFYYEGLVKGLEAKRDTVNKTERTDIGKMYNHIQIFTVDDKYKVYPERLLQKPKNDG